jgi:hypothetical protein
MSRSHEALNPVEEARDAGQQRQTEPCKRKKEAYGGPPLTAYGGYRALPLVEKQRLVRKFSLRDILPAHFCQTRGYLDSLIAMTKGLSSYERKLGCRRPFRSVNQPTPVSPSGLSYTARTAPATCARLSSSLEKACVYRVSLESQFFVGVSQV